ncbi:MAG TPA: DUF3149 domain-containing protein [Rhodoferax sp.]|jgi:hypothetical protein|nr:DUF3149 domain-containing protein [Rhodoferax sp.]
MKLLMDLVTTDYGLAGVAVTVLSLGMALGFRMFFIRKMRESEQAAQDPK